MFKRSIESIDGMEVLKVFYGEELLGTMRVALQKDPVGQYGWAVIIGPIGKDMYKAGSAKRRAEAWIEAEEAFWEEYYREDGK